MRIFTLLDRSPFVLRGIEQLASQRASSGALDAIEQIFADHADDLSEMAQAHAEMRNALERAEFRQALSKGELARMDLGRVMMHRGFGKLVQNAEFRQAMSNGNARNYIVE